MIDEMARRRPEFVPGIPIVLGDGQAWQFPEPVIELDLVPTFGPGGKFDSIGGRNTFGDDYDELVEEFYRAEQSGMLRALMGLGVALLGRNYDLTPEEYQKLLRYRPGDDTSRDMWQQIADVATGNAKKLLPVGDAPA